MQLQMEFPTSSPINKEKLSKQNKIVFDWLRRGNTIHVFVAIGMGIFHLHSRISDLRNRHGVIIHDRMIKHDGVSCKEYSLSQFNQPA